MSAATASAPAPAHQLQPEPIHATATAPAITPAPLEAPSGPVEADINFFNPPEDGSVPFNYVETPPAGEPSRNYVTVPHKVVISDARGLESTFSLDKHSFAALSGFPTTMAPADWRTDETVKAKYYPEVEAILRNICPTAHTVFIFDHTHRHTAPGADFTGPARGPVLVAHIDQTAPAALARVDRHMSKEDAPALKEGRVRLINIWRPLRKVVKFPLAVGDSSTFRDEDLVSVEHRYPDRTGATAAVKYADTERWWYWSGMDPEKGEVLALQCFDTETGSRTPHTAFLDPKTEGWEVPRESVEVRALVFG